MTTATFDTHYASYGTGSLVPPERTFLHSQLKPKRALRYAAELRFSRRTPAGGTRFRRVDAVIDR